MARTKEPTSGSLPLREQSIKAAAARRLQEKNNSASSTTPTSTNEPASEAQTTKKKSIPKLKLKNTRKSPTEDAAKESDRVSTSASTPQQESNAPTKKSNSQGRKKVSFEVDSARKMSESVGPKPSSARSSLSTIGTPSAKSTGKPLPVY